MSNNSSSTSSDESIDKTISTSIGEVAHNTKILLSQTNILGVVISVILLNSAIELAKNLLKHFIQPIQNYIKSEDACAVLTFDVVEIITDVALFCISLLCAAVLMKFFKVDKAEKLNLFYFGLSI